MEDKQIFEIFRYGWWSNYNFNLPNEELAELACQEDYESFKINDVEIYNKLINQPNKA